MVLPIQDINALADLIVIISCIVVIYVWNKKKYYHLSAAFIPIMAVFIVSFFLNKFGITGELDILIRTISNIVLVVSLAFMCTQIMKECRKLYVVFSLYIIFLISFFFVPDITTALLFMRIIGFIIILPFFIVLFAYKHVEIKVVSLFLLAGITAAIITIFAIILYPSMQNTLPFYINKICFAVAFILLAHFSVHKPRCIIGFKDRRRKRVRR